MTAGPFIIDIDHDGDVPVLSVFTPASVLMVLGADDLRRKLGEFSDPVKNGVIRNSHRGRRWYVEKILPALRFYCGKYGVEQPDWLVGNNHWESMSGADKKKLFGPGDLRLREFRYAQCPDIAVVRDEGGPGKVQ